MPEMNCMNHSRLIPSEIVSSTLTPATKLFFEKLKSCRRKSYVANRMRLSSVRHRYIKNVRQGFVATNLVCLDGSILYASSSFG